MHTSCENIYNYKNVSESGEVITDISERFDDGGNYFTCGKYDSVTCVLNKNGKCN
jgi:hypothetical protein